ncbi:hypothetical protein D3C75_795210 [compost metagenome]
MRRGVCNLKALNIIGWIFVPYIMVILRWKRSNVGVKIGGIAWGFLAFFITLGLLFGETTPKEDKAVVSNAKDSTQQSSVTASPTTKVNASNAPATQTQAPTEKPKAPFDVTLPFQDFSKAYFALPKAEQTSVFDTFLAKLNVSWEGIVIESGSSNVYFYGISDQYKGESWSAISSGKKEMLGYTIVAKMKDSSEAKKLKQGDKVTIQGELTSRGSDGESNWKLNDAKLTKYEAAPEKNKPSMSKAEFDKLESGMTYDEATVIIGGPGTVLSESGKKGGTGLEIHTVMYQYEGEGSLGANANLMFQDEKLINKAQFGLK